MIFRKGIGLSLLGEQYNTIQYNTIPLRTPCGQNVKFFFVKAGLCKNVSTLFTFVSMEWGVIEVWRYGNYKVMIESISEALSEYDSPCRLKSAYEKVCME